MSKFQGQSPLIPVGGAATARRFDVGVGDLKASAVEAVDVVDDRAEEPFGRFFIEVDGDSVGGNNKVIRVWFFRVVEKIFEPAATGCFFAIAKAPALFSLFCQNL